MDHVVPPRAGRREWVGLAVLALPCMLISMDLTVLNLAVPELSAELEPSSSQLLWIVDVYGFFVAGALVTMGTLGDRIGRRRLLLVGGAAFGVTSVLAAFATSAEGLIAARALLGLAGATLMPSTMGLIRTMFQDPAQRTIAIGVWITSFSVGGTIGPLAGGVMLEFFWWGSVFLLAVPVMALLLVVGPRLLPEFRDPDAGRLDLPSAALSVAAVLATVYGIKRMAEDGVGWAPALAILAGLTLGAVFVRRQRRLADPLIDLGLFRAPAFSAALATNALGIFAIFGAFLFMGQYLQLVLGLSPLEAGLWTLPSSLAFVVGSNGAPPLVRRVRPAVIVGAGLALATVGFGLLTQVDATGGLAVLVTGSVVFSLGLAPVFTLTNDLVVGAAPEERAGAASAISETGVELGGAVGIAVLGSIGTAVYRAEVRDALPAGLPAEDAERARDTLGGAVAVAERLGDPAGPALLEAAREAFVGGLHLASALSAAAVAATAVVAVALLRGERSGGAAEGPRDEGADVDGPAADVPRAA